MSGDTGGWDLFEKINSRAAEMVITVYKGGQFSLTKATCDAIDSEYVELLFNRNEMKIGIRPADSSSSNAYQLRQPKRQTSRILSAAAFIAYYQLDEIKGKKYQVKKEDDMVVFNVEKPID